jgi:hypothetical protein
MFAGDRQMAGGTRSMHEDRDPYEGTDREALQSARAELGVALDELKVGIDEVLDAARRRVDGRDHEALGEWTRVTPDVGGALVALLGKLPGVIGNSLSGDARRVGVARETLAGLDERLREAGVELGDGLTGFADRLAGLREETRPGA